jgi:hypothetical protein
VSLILPAVTGIAPVLVPLAATGAALLFAGAVITRLRRGEKVTIVVDQVYLALAVFVAWDPLRPRVLPPLTIQRAATGLTPALWRRQAEPGVGDNHEARTIQQATGHRRAASCGVARSR